MSERIEGLSIGLDLDSVKVESGLKDLNKKLSLVNSEMKANLSAFDYGDKSLQKYQVQLNGLNKKLDVQKTRVESARQSYDKMVKAHGEGSREAEQAAISYNKETAALNNLENYIGKVKDEMNQSTSVSKKYGEQLTNISEKAGKLGTVLTSTVTPAMLALGAAAIVGAKNYEDASIKIQNNMGSTVEETEKLTNVANNVFKDGWGDSLDSVVNSLLEVKEQLGDLPDEDLESITKQAIALEQSLGMDTSESLRGVSALMKGYGLTAQEAFDYLVTGAQNGLNKTDELGDNLAEYVPLWEQNGYSIESMFATLEAGLDAGAYNLDKVNDLVKEFGIRTGDGTVKKAIEEMGGSWENIYNDWEKAGGTNAELFESLAKNLASIKDPQQKQLALTEIWGSIGEDAGLKVVEALGNVEAGYGDVSGAAEKVADNMELSKTQQFQALLRETADTLVPLGDILLEIGEDALPILQDAVENISDAWNGLSEDQQQMVVDFGLTAAAAGPLIKIFSGLTGGAGNLLSKLPSLAKGTSDTSKAMETMSSVATKGTTGTSLLAKGIGSVASISGPAALAIGGIALAIGAGTVIWKAWGEDAYEAGERTKQWGSDIGEEASNALAEFQTLSDEAGLATDLMSFNIEEGTTRAVDAYTGMAENIKNDIQTTITETEEGLAGLPESVKKIVAESMTAGVEEQTKLIAEVDEIQSAITGIYENALAENREVTDAELVIIENYHSRLAEIRSETLQLSAEEQRNVQAVMTEDLKSFSAEQLRQRQAMLAEETKVIQDGYDEQSEMLKEQQTSGKISKQEYNDAMAALNAAEIADLSEIGVEYLKVWQERGDIPLETQKKILADMGLSYDEIQAQLDLVNQKTAQSNEMLAKSSSDASEEVRKANDSWNGMILDEKTGEVKTNLTEVITEASQSEEGWNELQFIMQNAELDTNAKEEIMDALMANGMWWEMDFPTQFADVETNAGQTATSFLQANYDWENMKYEDQMAILNSNSSETLQQALIDTGVWENLSPSEKELIMSTNAGRAAQEALIAMGLWNGLNEEEKQMVVTSNSTEEAIKGVQANYTWNGTNWIPKDANVKTNAPDEVNKGVNSNNTWNQLKYGNKFANLSTNAPSEANKGVNSNNTWNGLKYGNKHAYLFTNAPTEANKGVNASNTWSGLSFYGKYANLNTNADTTENKLSSANKYFSSIQSKTRTFTLKYETLGTPRGYAKGTNYHPGGPAILGDGGKHEPFVTPKGHVGISPKTDTLFHLPRGTKVFPSVESWKNKLPHFANGSANTPTDAMKLLAISGRNIERRNQVNNNIPENQSEMSLEQPSETVISELIAGQNTISKLLNQLINSEGKPVVMNIDGRVMGTVLVPILDKQNGQLIYETGEGVNI